jgi:hypothetical protein
LGAERAQGDKSSRRLVIRRDLHAEIRRNGRDARSPPAGAVSELGGIGTADIAGE